MKRITVQIKYLLLCVLTGIIPVLITFPIIYNVMYQSMTNQVHTMQVQGLKQAAQETEKLYLNVPAIATRICNRYKLNKKSTDFLDVKTMMDLNRYALTDNPYIDSIYIYDPEKNTLVVDDQFADWNTFSEKD